MPLEVKDLEPLEVAIKGHKEATEAMINAFKEQAKTDFATPGAIKAMEEALSAKIEEVNKYAQAIEKTSKAKKLTDTEQASFDALLSKCMEESEVELKTFINTKKGNSLRFDVAQKAVDMGIGVSVTNGPGASFTTVIPGIKALPNRRVHMRDIVPLGTMTSLTLTYMRETGTTGAPAPWAENSGEKTQVDARFQEVTVKAEWIAAWLRISRQMLEDLPAMRSYLQMRLLEMYLIVEDAQILNGNGTSPNIQGIMPLATAATVTTGANVERLIWALAQLAQKNYTGNGIIVNPSAYYAIALNKATGSGEYDLPGMVVVSNGQLYIAGVPVYMTTAMAYNQYLVGDWIMGAQFFIREQPQVEFFDQDGDNVRTNRITVRIEGRAAMAIPYPEAFVKGTFDANIPNFPVS